MQTKNKRQQMVYLVLNQILKTGFKDLKMDDFINMLPISRSTVYRYFDSREDIISAVVDEYVKYLDQFQVPLFPKSEDAWVQLVEQQLEEALILNSHLSDSFLRDLKEEFPTDFNRLQAKIDQHDQQLITAFHEGQRQKYFNDTRPELWILQDRLMIPQIINPQYLVAHSLTIQQVINSYVVMKKLDFLHSL